VLRQLLARAFVGLAILFAASAVVFFATEVLPGDPARSVLGREASPEALAALRKEFGFDRPVLERYGEWLGGIAHGDLGKSFPSGEPVSEVVSGKIRTTAALALLTLAVLIPVALVLGVVSAIRPGRLLDHGIAATTLALIATPEFVVGSLLILIFALGLGVLPPISLVDPSRGIFRHPVVFVLPVLTLLANSIAQMIRMIRATMIDVLESPYIEVARLKGVPEWRVLFVHALPNALAPALQLIALSIAWLAGGVIIVESLFDMKGVGLELKEAVTRRDLATVQALTLMITFVYVAMNFLADAAVILLNPRLRRAR
jgi:peptide/nickel transport system permease protein